MAAQWYTRGADGIWRCPGRPPLTPAAPPDPPAGTGLGRSVLGTAPLGK